MLVLEQQKPRIAEGSLEEHEGDSCHPPPYTKNDTASTTFPWGGKSFIIRLCGSNKILSVDRKGSVQLAIPMESDSDAIKGFEWECVEKNGWFGFKQDGKFLGRGRGFCGWGHLSLEATTMGVNRGFTVRQHPDGGYQIMAINKWSYDKLSVDHEGQKLALTREDNALWEFVSV
ncbi:hypothetical protein VHEMI09260 [[Torrubiella] hemipterigena]|uniref:Uncharacterized protein n=1 Tax=[Torrubiella] hemipterigena TaxID=1531966 RepID=A0A0A1TR90_9HYPO|nr:hypothetical protein VHEMI09260 [[Torrubiella] hemipterigena]